ncbi:MAG: amino acid efflux transporter [Bradyrhizobium sp.]|jgi:amino acid efflux transporter|nr:amino acid efflux transporter [Bradyrhizobium sp.]
MTQPTNQLAKTLTLASAVALALGICIGAGLLVLTGLAYQQSGDAAIYAWIIDGLMIVPILAILAYLGAKHPNAEGVAGIVRSAFGKNAGVAVQALLIGTFSLGLPGISIVGGNYFAFLIGGGGEVALAASAAILIFAGLSNYFGARLSGGIQRILTFSLLVIITLVAVSALAFGDHSAGAGIAAPDHWQDAIPSLNVIFFAFAGWVLVASTVEEYKNPARDYPLAVFISFAIVFALYVLIALATQLMLSRSDPNLATAPVAAILAALLGSASAKVVAIVGVLIVAANLNGATWGFSRLVMASARNGLLPSRLSIVSAKYQVPTNAVIASTAIFMAVLALYSVQFVSLSTLFGLAGQNFFILYLLCVVSFIKKTTNMWLRLAAAFLTVLYLLWAGSYGLKLLYPLFLMCFGIAALYLKERSVQLSVAHGPKQ